MHRITRFRPTPAMVVASFALLVALGGTSIAAVSTLAAPNSVGTAQVIDHSLLKQDFKSGQLPKGPAGHAGPQGPAGTVDTTNFYTKADSDGRYLRGTITVVGSVSNIPLNTFGSTIVRCPAGYQAVGGGVAPENVSTDLVTESSPVIDNSDIVSAADGNHGVATGWQGSMHNVTNSTQFLKVAVICAPIG